MISDIHFDSGENGPYVYGEFPISAWEVIVAALAVLAVIVWIIWFVTRKKQ
ncbi:MAG TPA: hypothetical protein VK961_05655 [Chthoniobacter sp.]|nr:hypothetical protein [Chthoniobacter sp.]